MKKFYLNLLAVLAMVVTCVGFASCSSDDDDDDNKKDNIENITGSNDGSSTSNSLVGTWRHNLSDGTGYVTCVFNADGTGYSQEFDEGRPFSPDFFTWVYNSKTKMLNMIYPDEDNYVETWIVKTLNSRSMILVDEYGDEDAYTRQ